MKLCAVLTSCCVCSNSENSCYSKASGTGFTFTHPSKEIHWTRSLFLGWVCSWVTFHCQTFINPLCFGWKLALFLNPKLAQPSWRAKNKRFKVIRSGLKWVTYYLGDPKVCTRKYLVSVSSFLKLRLTWPTFLAQITLRWNRSHGKTVCALRKLLDLHDCPLHLLLMSSDITLKLDGKS